MKKLMKQSRDIFGASMITGINVSVLDGMGQSGIANRIGKASSTGIGMALTAGYGMNIIDILQKQGKKNLYP